MPSGLLYGLVAAAGWGLVDVIASVTGKRLGPIAFAAATQSIGLAVFVALAIITRTTIGPTAAGEAFLFGGVAAIGYLAAFTALRIGPLAVVSPVMASYGGLTVVLAVVFRNEQLTSAQWVGVALTTSGIVLAALVLDDGIRKARPVSAGVAFALIACLGFAFATVGLAAPIQAAGWLPATVISRFGNVALVLHVPRRCGRPEAKGPRWGGRTPPRRGPGAGDRAAGGRPAGRRREHQLRRGPGAVGDVGRGAQLVVRASTGDRLRGPCPSRAAATDAMAGARGARARRRRAGVADLTLTRAG